MTTIAFDGTTLAADRMFIQGTTPCSIGTKLARTSVPGHGECRVGVAGAYWSIKEAIETTDDKSITAMAVDAKGKCWVRIGRGEWERTPADKWAIGSGAHLALGAMLAGASAVRAIAIATMIDTCTGGGCDTLKA